MKIYSQNKIGYEHEDDITAKTGPYGLKFCLQNGKHMGLGFTIPIANIKKMT